MSPMDIFGVASSVVAAAVIAKASWTTNTARVWKEEAEAQKVRADRLEDDLAEIKERLANIEKENARLIELLTALDPDRLRGLRI